MVKQNFFSGRAFLDYFFMLLLFVISFIVFYAGFNIFSLSGALAVQSSSIISPSLVVIFGGFDSGGTNFSMIGTQDLGAVPNVTLVKSGSALFFPGIINMSADSNTIDKIINLSAYINMTSTSVSVDSVRLPNFNRSAHITFSGLSFVSPRLLMDGSLCPSTICTNESYSGGNFSFNVAHFTTYSVEEGAVTQVPPVVQISGGLPSVVLKFFTILDTPKVPYVVKQGAVVRGEFVIRNDASKPKLYSVSTSLPGILFFDESDVTILPGEYRTIAFTMVAQEYMSPTIYSAKIRVDDGSLVQEFTVLINVQERQPLFDVSVTTKDDSREFNQGAEKIPINISIKNLGDSYLLDVLLKIQFMDMNGAVLSEQTESVAIDKTIQIIRDVSIPKNVSPEEYIIAVTVTYEGKEAVGGVLVRIVPRSVLEAAAEVKKYGVKEWALLASAILFFTLLLGYVTILARRNGKRKD